ncbi:dolichol kinase, partial [Candidatus Bathyarchaeota archaeon]|nr:dolichol kinase [Candidatus Bathyarchaeota archaeon]
NVAIYYNRKVIHVFTGGIVALLVPIIFETPILPFIMAMLLAVFTYLPHKTGKLMYWFQTADNMYEVSFCIMWGVIIALGWLISNGNFWVGILPAVFMSIGDAVTGVVRNILYQRRTKSWWGNLAMALFTIPTGITLGLAGMIAGAAASIVEHFEFNPIDDNVTVPITSFIIILLSLIFAPQTLTL